MYSDYFLTLVKDMEGAQTLLVIPRVEGVSTRHMTMSGSSSAGTAFVEFDDVKVPVDNLVGQRGQAFKYIVSNFNHEVSVRGLRKGNFLLILHSGFSSRSSLYVARGFVFRTRSSA